MRTQRRRTACSRSETSSSGKQRDADELVALGAGARITRIAPLVQPSAFRNFHQLNSSLSELRTHHLTQIPTSKCLLRAVLLLPAPTIYNQVESLAGGRGGIEGEGWDRGRGGGGEGGTRDVLLERSCWQLAHAANPQIKQQMSPRWFWLSQLEHFSARAFRLCSGRAGSTNASTRRAFSDSSQGRKGRLLFARLLKKEASSAF